jgi:hypothetical protein
MKTRDSIARELAQIILSSAQSEADEGRGFIVADDILADLRPAGRATMDVARRAVGIEDRIWDAELRHFMFVREIIAGTRKARRSS